MQTFSSLQELFSEKSRWIKDSSAEDNQGRTIDPNSEAAVSWCLLGGIIRVYGRGTTKSAQVMTALHFKLDGIACWNDQSERKFEDVVALVKELEI